MMSKNPLKLSSYKEISTNLIKTYSNNSRNHSEHQIDQIVKSITEFGFTNPLLIDENNQIIAGHGRLEAAKILNIESLPCIVFSHLTQTQKRAYIIADNKLALNAGWDISKLQTEFELLRDEDFNLELTGFSLEELIDIFPDDNPEVFCDEDDCPVIPEEPITKPGDIWVLGDHRLMCGDSTSIDAVDKLMNGVKADMVFTDPPYGVNFEQGKFIGRDKQAKNRNFQPILNDEKKGDELKEFLKECFTNSSCLSDCCSIYVWSPSLVEGFAILNSLLESGWHIQSQIIWNKSPFVIGRADYHWKHEVCWYGYKGKNHQWHGGRTKATVWDVAKTNTSNLHPTMKPTALAEIACENSTKKGDSVLDLFGGSGSTLIACEKTQRKCFMMELDPKYCDVIIKRWENYSGKKAILEQ
jgi:site-specific DNA-methyltransferase (adenine-specific)